jgi:hypothetical protein
MTKDWESIFRGWSKPVSDTEEEKCANTERMIRDAIDKSSALNKLNIEIFTQGSYKNNTNIRLDSDVDISVLCRDYIFSERPNDGSITQEQTGLLDSDYSYLTFKDEVGAALVGKFGNAMVVRGKKAFDVHASSYRVDADVVPCFEHRRYRRNSLNQIIYYSGVEFRPDDGGSVINWPKQHYENGVQKNKDTGGKFKFTTRILKKLRNEMNDENIIEANNLPSYLIECLVWNVENKYFSSPSYYSNVREILANCFNSTLNDDSCKEWCEVSEMKWLFFYSQPWTRQQAHSFLSAAWDYVGFE